MTAISFFAADGAPTLIQQYGPLLAALIALLGALVTLRATARRERRKDFNQREDKYRDDARAAVSGVLASATQFARYGRVLSVRWRWVRLGYADASKLAETTETAMKELNQALVTAQLLVAEEDVGKLLCDLDNAADDAADLVHSALDAFWDNAAPRRDEDEAPAIWSRFDSSCRALRDATLQTLRPTVKGPQRRWLHFWTRRRSA